MTTENQQSEAPPAWAAAIIERLDRVEREQRRPKSAAALVPILMQRIGVIGKERNNQKIGYNFRGIDDVLNYVGPPAAELGLRCEIQIADYKRDITGDFSTQGGNKFTVHVTLRMIVTFSAPDGSKHTVEGIGEGIDYTGDKASNKAMASAFKYACFLGFIIPVEGVLDDGDTEGPEGAGTAGAAAPKAGVQSSRGKRGKAGEEKKPEPATDPGDRIPTITTKQLNAIGKMKEKLGWSDATAAEKVKLISKGATSNAAELTTEEASDMIQKMTEAMNRKSNPQDQ